jgi:uncharacterized protein YbjT (DUF2867 family)
MHNSSAQHILVLGGTGFVGRHVCEALSRQGHIITVPTRHLPARSVDIIPGVDVLEADIHDPAQLQSLVNGHDAVVNLVAILHGDEAAYDHVHVQLLRKLVKACKAEQVKRLVHISALGANDHAPSMYQRSKARGEAVLTAAAQTSDLALTVIRPSVIFGEDDHFINLFAKLQKVFPFMPLASAQTRFQPVWVQDVAKAIVACLEDPSTAGKVYELYGPEVLTLKQLVQFAGRWVGYLRPIFPLPYPIGWLQALFMEIIPGPTLMSRDNLDAMQVDNIPTGRLPGLAELGIAHPQTLSGVFLQANT